MRRFAFTLVELMVTIIIISILAAITLGALQKARQAADIAKTRSLIAKLHGQMMLRWESYRTRRLPIGGANAATRLAAVRELMRLELPERWSDVYDVPVMIIQDADPLKAGTALWKTYYRQYQTAITAYPPATDKRVEANEDAECLYMILTTGGEDDALGAEQFNPSDIGDIDNDGLPEFHDAWGQPIRFLRWAPGFVSDLQPENTSVPTGSDPRMSETRHDPFDPLKLQKYKYDSNPANMQYGALMLYPLIYSLGIDRQSDVYHGPPDFSYQDTQVDVGSNDPYATLKPYADVTSAPPEPWTFSIGFTGNIDNDDDDGWADNIHNHLIGLR